jgi:hypothetical protein
MVCQLRPSGRFEEHTTAVSNYRVSSNVFADLSELEAVRLDGGIRPFMGHAVAKQEFNDIQRSLVIFLAVDAQFSKFGSSNSRRR